MLISNIHFGQVFTNTYSDPRIGTTGLFGKKDKVKTQTLSELDSYELRSEIKNESIDKPFQFGKIRPLNLSISSGDWENITNDTSVWRLKIISKKALSITINFDRFHLTDDPEMYIYNEGGIMITGPITSKENNPENIWGSSIYKGDAVIIEIKVPTISKEKNELHIKSISHGYKEMFIDKTFGQSGGCNINVLCPLGNGWVNERNSVALVLNASGNEHCSGTLINNVCNTNIPYFLTANHCYTSNSAGAVSNWRFIFQYWSPACIPSRDGSRSVLFNGSTLRANYAASDFALLELTQTPPANSGINFSGWSRSATNPAFTTGIHHPSGDVMKISQDNVAPIKTNYPGLSGNNHWKVDWDNGVTEGGSSGSALFDENHRIIGQLHGGYSSCSSSDLRDWYGAFDISWTGGGTNSTRLSNWLDPNNLGIVTTNTTDVSTLGSSTSSAYILGSDNFCSGSSQYNINPVLPPGTSISWTISNNSIGTITPTGSSATLTMISEGTVTITATITQCGTTVLKTKTVTMGFPYFFNPVNGADTATPYGHYTFSQPLPWNYPTPSNYYWKVPSGWTILFGQGTSNIYVEAGPVGSGGPVEVDVTACGLTRLNHKYVAVGYSNCNGCIPDVINPSDGEEMKLKISPNPAHNTAMLTLAPTTNKLKNRSYSIQQIKISDKMGSIKKQMSFKTKELSQSIYIGDLLPDIYVVSVYDGQICRNIKLIVQ